jgi:hypothetical protein
MTIKIDSVEHIINIIKVQAFTERCSIVSQNEEDIKVSTVKELENTLTKNYSFDFFPVLYHEDLLFNDVESFSRKKNKNEY